MEKEFLQKLRASLEALDSRIAGLEHLVNDVIIGGLKSAADEYEDDVKFSEFCDRNKESYESYIEPSIILYGEDYDLPSELYEAAKSKSSEEGYEEAAFVSSVLHDIQSKIDSLENLKEKVEEKAEVENKEEVEKKDEIPSEEELSKDFDDFATKN